MSMPNQDLPDLRAGISISNLTDGAMLAGRVGDENALLVRSGDAIHAVGAHCTHYGADLAAGLVAGQTLRCPLHHAAFDLRSGEALCAPALDPLPCWRVEHVGELVFVRERRTEPRTPQDIVIVGGGGAGFAAADMLRRAGYAGRLTMVSADAEPPCDRPNLSKEFLAGEAPDDFIPLRPAAYYAERGIEMVLGTAVRSIDPKQHRVELAGGRQLHYDSLLLATGAEPVALDIPGADTSTVHYLRSAADSRAIVSRANSVCRAVVVGASFIGLEVAASLRARGIDVDVVAPDAVPMARVFGNELGRWVQGLHEANGVRFHLGRTVAHIDRSRVTLSDGTVVHADLVIAGVGVRPRIALAEQAGLTIDRGVLVDRNLQTSAPGIYAAGDIARWPDPHSGENIRVEHWVVAQRQGQVAALNMLGRRTAFDAVPFFWTRFYGVSIRYVGHAESWGQADITGSLELRDAAVSYRRGDRTVAVATIARDTASLEFERATELGLPQVSGGFMNLLNGNGCGL